MRLQSVLGTAAAAVLTAGLAVPAAAQESRFTCDTGEWSSRNARHCEIRTSTVPAASSVLHVNGRPNGSIEVIGSSRSDVEVRARVTGYAPTEAEARQIAAGVRVETTPGQIGASGPRDLGDRRSWSVSYQVLVPMHTWLSLESTNGSIRIRGVEGEIDFRTTNGSVHLSQLAGQVRGRTTNGAVSVELDGPTWTGQGLDVETTNGAVSLRVPDGYSARVQATTTNGRTRVDFPVTMQGRLDRGMDITLGSGGPTIKVTTRNGGVHVGRQ